MSETQSEISTVDAVALLTLRQEELIARELTVLQEGGGAASCREGCAACCRQFVVVSPMEALAIGQHARAAAPAQRRRWDEAHVRHRGQLARRPSLVRRLQAFRAAGGYLTPAAGDTLERDYWAARLPCPFLDSDRCTIYPVRPFACREHFALTPAEWCARDLDAVVTPPTRFEFRAIAGQMGEQSFGLEDRLIPLYTALDYAAEQRPAARRTAPLAAITRLLDAALARVMAWRRQIGW